jgi:HK97 family phage prohead protease
VVDYKAIPLEVVELKAGQDGWSFSAYASVFNKRDLGGDIIQPGAFDATLKSSNFRPLLWQHDMREPIGIEKSLKADQKGLLGSWEIIDTQRGQDAYKLLKRGAVRSMSIGYIPDAFEFDDEGQTRILKSIELLENSVVSIPMQPAAQVQSVKNAALPELDKQVSFEMLVAQVKGYLLVGVDEAEALHARRLEEQRELTSAHIDALELLNDELKGSTSRIEAILSAVHAPAAKAHGALSLRVELARRRLRAAGVVE